MSSLVVKLPLTVYLVSLEDANILLVRLSRSEIQFMPHCKSNHNYMHVPFAISLRLRITNKSEASKVDHYRDFYLIRGMVSLLTILE